MCTCLFKIYNYVLFTQLVATPNVNPEPKEEKRKGRTASVWM